jgi:hypothetical protein
MLFGLVIALALGIAGGQGPAATPKKLIYYGWGSPDTQYVREHWQDMEKMPFDGVGLVVAVDRQAWQQGKRDTGNQLGWQVMGRRMFQVEEFREAIADLTTPQWQTMTDHFLPVALSAQQSATGLNWFDDARWQVIANNFGVMAQIAAAGRMKGLILDPEHYNYGLFSYAQQRGQVDKLFAEYVAMARQRGREIMTAVAAAKPDVVLFSLFGYTLPLTYMRDGKRLHDVHYSLLPAFYDGLLEAMPAGVQFVDGYELAYAFKDRRQFFEAYHNMHHKARALSAVPDHYRAKVGAGFGLWLDNGNKPDYFTPQELQQAVSTALEVSDGYVWIYSHRPRFFPLADIQEAYLEALAAARREVRK